MPRGVPKRRSINIRVSNVDVSKMLLLLKNIAVFDARRVGLGAQNRPEEGSQGVKRPVRRALTEMRRDEKQSIVSRQIELIIVNVF